MLRVALGLSLVAVLCVGLLAWGLRPPQLGVPSPGLVLHDVTVVEPGRNRRVRRAIHCGVHKRLYGLAVASDRAFLSGGEFMALVERGLPQQRADYLIDPWSTAYWLRYSCADDEGRRSLFLYSFGPNRLRDSDDWELGGDDVAVYLVGPPRQP